jgi:hypothetical protein
MLCSIQCHMVAPWTVAITLWTTRSNRGSRFREPSTAGRAHIWFERSELLQVGAKVLCLYLREQLYLLQKLIINDQTRVAHTA